MAGDIVYIVAQWTVEIMLTIKKFHTTDVMFFDK